MNVRDRADTASQREDLLDGVNKILIVDDDEVTREILRAYLADDYVVFAVPSGKRALDFLTKHTVDLILLDYMMPEMDGPTTFRRIRHGFPKARLPIVFLTGVSEKELVIKGLQLCPQDYLLKPVDRRVLLERVSRVLTEEYIPPAL